MGFCGFVEVDFGACAGFYEEGAVCAGGDALVACCGLGVGDCGWGWGGVVGGAIVVCGGHCCGGLVVVRCG